ncbi:hypothetical protein GCM10009785_13900 [Brooklawnia cerclae]|uniref:Uncharacterized protein n=1 Tax=Brooklawnia cerclae TaxID=349934 RepID=A0ABX0SMP7_9ACTN|nr:hypothetical protein [Brooklawnia cerclae]NIH58041.1 hypothetical protein [Brooklawnia cerclae]
MSTVIDPKALFASAVTDTAAKTIHSLAERADQLMAERDHLNDQLTRIADEVALAVRNPDRLDPSDARLVAFEMIRQIVVEEGPESKRAVGPYVQSLPDPIVIPARRASKEER